MSCPNGLIPQEIEKLESLMTLIISSNLLEKDFSIQIINLHGLIDLDLSFRTLSGITPNDVGKLKNFTTIVFRMMFSVTNFLINCTTW